MITEYGAGFDKWMLAFGETVARWVDKDMRKNQSLIIGLAVSRLLPMVDLDHLSPVGSLCSHRERGKCDRRDGKERIYYVFSLVFPVHQCLGLELCLAHASDRGMFVESESEWFEW